MLRESGDEDRVNVPKGRVGVPTRRVACHYFAEIEAGAKAATGPKAEGA